MAMANNIDTSLNSYRQINGSTDTPKTREDNAATTGRSEGSRPAADTVQVTQSARELASLEKAIANSSVVDQERVDALRSSIADGSYNVVSEKVADGLLSMDRALPVN